MIYTRKFILTSISRHLAKNTLWIPMQLQLQLHLVTHRQRSCLELTLSRHDDRRPCALTVTQRGNTSSK